MKISIIVALTNRGVIGADNKLLWKLSDDLKIFKQRTSGHAIIMGRKTFDSIGRPLPNRTNIVISKNPDLKLPGCLIATSMESAIEIAKSNSDKNEIFIIGGAQIYQLALTLVNKIYITYVKKDFEGDAFFDLEFCEDWKQISVNKYFKSEVNECDFDIIVKEK